jgi:hypothetical protein
MSSSVRVRVMVPVVVAIALVVLSSFVSAAEARD